MSGAPKSCETERHTFGDSCRRPSACANADGLTLVFCEGQFKREERGVQNPLTSRREWAPNAPLAAIRTQLWRSAGLAACQVRLIGLRPPVRRLRRTPTCGTRPVTRGNVQCATARRARG